MSLTVGAAAAAGALGLASGVGTNLLSWGEQRNLNEQMQQINLENAKQYPSAYIEGLKKAGINPASAFGSVGLNSSMSSGSGGRAPSAPDGSIVSNAFREALAKDKDFFKNYENAIKSNADDVAKAVKEWASNKSRWEREALLKDIDPSGGFDIL